MAPQPTIVDIYTRVSTDPQDDNTSHAEQERCARQYCAEHGLTVGLVHRETFSGFVYRERQKLGLLRDRYRDGKIQGVVVRTFDRLSRKQVHAAVLLDEMEHAGIRLHCVMEPVNQDDSKMAQFVQMVMAFIAEIEREKIMDRTMTGRVNAVKRGELKAVSTYKLRYGYQWADESRTSIILKDEEAAIVREMAEQYGAGVGSVTIRNSLNERGVPSPSGRQWQECTIMRILGDVRITGTQATVFTNKATRYKTHHDTLPVPDGTYPQIISMELFNQIQRRMALNKAQATRSSKQPEEFLLRAGYVRCSVCGWAMGARTDARYGHFCYRCRQHGSIVSKPLDMAIWQQIEELAKHVALIEQAIQLATQDTKIEHDAAALDLSIKRWQKSAANFLKDLADPDLVDESRAAIRHQMNHAQTMVVKLHGEKAHITAGLVDRARERAAYQEILDWCKEIKEARGELSYQRKRDFLELLGVVVTVIYDEKGKGNQSRPTYDMRVRLPALQEIISVPEEAELVDHTCSCTRYKYFIGANASGLYINPALLAFAPAPVLIAAPSPPPTPASAVSTLPG